MSVKVGDQVELKSGGPPMTVDFVGEVSVKCKWFDGDRKLQTGNFQPDSLKPWVADEDEGVHRVDSV